MYRMIGMARVALLKVDPFDYVKNNSVTTAKGLTSLAASWVKLMMVLGFFGIIVMLMVQGFKVLLFNGDPHEKTAIKKRVVIQIIIAVVISGFIELAGAIYLIVSSVG